MVKITLPIKAKSRYGKNITDLDNILRGDKIVLINKKDYLIINFSKFKKIEHELKGYIIFEILPDNCFPSSKAHAGYKGWLGQIITFGGYYPWLKKWSKLRKKGNKKIKFLLANDKNFLERWKQKTRKGGKALKPEQRWIFKSNDRRIKEGRIKGGKRGGKSLVEMFGNRYMKTIGSKGGLKSIKSINNFRKKKMGPRKEKMFNMLEVKVAEQILSLGLDYWYEKPLKVDGSFVIPDFCLKKYPNVFIECTSWSEVKMKSKKLNKRFNLLKKNNPKSLMIVITKLSLLEKYKEKLNKEIKVCDINNLKHLLCPGGSAVEHLTNG